MIEIFEKAQVEIPLEPSLFGIKLLVYSLFGRLIPNHSFSGIIKLLSRYDNSFLGSLFDFKMHCISILCRGKHILLNNNILQFSRACARKTTYLEEKKKEGGMSQDSRLFLQRIHRDSFFGIIFLSL